MKLFTHLISLLKKPQKLARKSIEDYKQELLLKQGKEQFEKLLQRGLRVPVALL